MLSPESIQQAIDRAYERFVDRLPLAQAAVAHMLPHRLGLTAGRDVPWSAVFNNVAVLGFPALLFEGRAPAMAPAILDGAIEAHLFALVFAFGADRIGDGQTRADAALREVVRKVRQVRDEAFAALVRTVDGEVFDYHRGERETTESRTDEEEVFAGAARADVERYRDISRRKQGLAFPACLAAARAAHFTAEDVAHVDAAVAGASLGLQYRDDVVDWLDDQSTSGSWAVALLEAPPAGARAGEVTDAMHARLRAEGTLVRMLRLSSEAFASAAAAARALGASSLAMWATRQAELTNEVAAREADEHGYAVRWEKERIAQKTQRQEALGRTGRSLVDARMRLRSHRTDPDAHGMSLDRRRRWDAMFDFYDVNGDAQLSEDDVRVRFQRLLDARNITDGDEKRRLLEALRDGFARRVLDADLNGDGCVTREEWHAHHEAELSHGGYYLPSPAVLRSARAAFEAFDLDGDGRMTTADFLGWVGLSLPGRFAEPALRDHFTRLCHRYGSDDGLDGDQFLAAHVEMLCAPGDAPFWLPIA